ncbi:hypothetical protein ACI78V_14105 [Geodermatophilus sp. SYSU D00742]
MISTMRSSAPARISGPGRLVARPAACGGRPVALRLRALPLTAAVATRVSQTVVPGAPVGVPAFGIAPTTGGFDATRATGATRVAGAFGTTGARQQNTTHNGTTPLGIHSPGRPLS